MVLSEAESYILPLYVNDVMVILSHYHVNEYLLNEIIVKMNCLLSCCRFDQINLQMNSGTGKKNGAQKSTTFSTRLSRILSKTTH